MTKITFIGTGGGRFATIFQKRATGGIYIADRGLLIHLDPGPGALVRMYDLDLDPTQTDAILVSHCHPDHYNDAEILMESMTMGGKSKRGIVIGSESVVEGSGKFRSLSDYHKGLVKKIKTARPGDTFVLKDWYEVEVTPARHSDDTTVGFKLHLNEGIVSYTSDTEYFDELAEVHKGARTLIICMTRPLEGKIPFHLSTEDAAMLVEAVKPELAVLTHMGMKVLPMAAEQANWITEKTKTPTIAAKDGIRIYMGEKIELKKR